MQGSNLPAEQQPSLETVLSTHEAHEVTRHDELVQLLHRGHIDVLPVEDVLQYLQHHSHGCLGCRHQSTHSLQLQEGAGHCAAQPDQLVCERLSRSSQTTVWGAVHKLLCSCLWQQNATAEVTAMHAELQGRWDRSC